MFFDSFMEQKQIAPAVSPDSEFRRDAQFTTSLLLTSGQHICSLQLQ